MRAAIIICAAGQSTRFGGKKKKVFEQVAGKPAFLYSVNIFSEMEEVVQIIMAVSEEDLERVEINWGANLSFAGVQLCTGGSSRAQTVRNALKFVREDVDVVAVHDAARCCITEQLVKDVLAEAAESGAAILASPVTATIKKGEGAKVSATLPREDLYEAQTPQAFSRKLLAEAYEQSVDLDTATDDCKLVELLGMKPSIVLSDATNLKITTATDLSIAEAILNQRRKEEKPKGFHPFSDDGFRL
ncbi:MAG: 2-C-methyl-D-erythritol 4-phosphate cytidylyltransferase [Phycisphaerae bacterium]|jgi:2-C-methyl-D-erythritol 4-phosphate cytidylyltransferase